MKRIIFLSLLVSSFSLLVTQTAQAIELGFATNKSLFDAEIIPGTVYQDRLTVFNTSEQIPLPMHLEMALWNLKEDSEDDIEFITAEDAINATKWFYIETPELQPLAPGYDFTLDPGGAEELVFRVMPPANAAAGTYLVSMRFQADLPDSYFESSGPRFIPEVAVLFFLRVPYVSGADTSSGYQAEIISLGFNRGPAVTAGGGVFESMAKTLVARVANNGAFYFKATGSVEVKNWRGSSIRTIPLPGRYLLPGRTRSLEISLQNPERRTGFWGGLADFVTDHLYFGRYTATLTLEYPAPAALSDAPAQPNRFIQKQVSFWIVPWAFVLIVASFLWFVLNGVGRFSQRVGIAVYVMFGGSVKKPRKRGVRK